MAVCSSLSCHRGSDVTQWHHFWIMLTSQTKSGSYYDWIGIAQWLERRTRDQRAMGSSQGRAAGDLFSSPGSTFCADSYFGIRFTSMLPQLHVKDPDHSAKSTHVLDAVARKRSRQKYRWKVTAKHACTLRCGCMCLKWRDMVVNAPRRQQFHVAPAT